MYVSIIFYVMFMSDITVTAIGAGKTKAAASFDFFDFSLLNLLWTVLWTRCLCCLRFLSPGTTFERHVLIWLLYS